MGFTYLLFFCAQDWVFRQVGAVFSHTQLCMSYPSWIEGVRTCVNVVGTYTSFGFTHLRSAESPSPDSLVETGIYWYVCLGVYVHMQWNRMLASFSLSSLEYRSMQPDRQLHTLVNCDRFLKCLSVSHGWRHRRKCGYNFFTNPSAFKESRTKSPLTP